MREPRAYVAYGECHCRLEIREDDRTDELTIKATSEWIFRQMKAGREVRYTLLEYAGVDECEHGPQAAPLIQQQLLQKGTTQ